MDRYLGSCDTTSIVFPGVDFTSENTLTVYTHLLNGGNDAYAGNDTLKHRYTLR